MCRLAPRGDQLRTCGTAVRCSSLGRLRNRNRQAPHLASRWRRLVECARTESDGSWCQTQGFAPLSASRITRAGSVVRASARVRMCRCLDRVNGNSTDGDGYACNAPSPWPYPRFDIDSGGGGYRRTGQRRRPHLPHSSSQLHHHPRAECGHCAPGGHRDRSSQPRHKVALSTSESLLTSVGVVTAPEDPQVPQPGRSHGETFRARRLGES